MIGQLGDSTSPFTAKTRIDLLGSVGRFETSSSFVVSSSFLKVDVAGAVTLGGNVDGVSAVLLGTVRNFTAGQMTVRGNRRA